MIRAPALFHRPATPEPLRLFAHLGRQILNTRILINALIDAREFVHNLL